jgi:hypothetical protein
MAKPPIIPVELMSLISDYMTALYPNQELQLVMLAATEGLPPSLMANVCPECAHLLMAFCVDHYDGGEGTTHEAPEQGKPN